ncbi:MAG: NAD(P)H-hydrate dehydratase [Bacteroidota bacterium]
MNIYNSDQIKAWDTFTIEHEPIASIDLMERAAMACTEWIIHSPYVNKSFHIFCGKGNNGGDGLAIARLLIQLNKEVDVYILEHGAPGTPEFQTNLHLLHNTTHRIHFLQSADVFPSVKHEDIIIDALFGIGLSRPVEGLAADLIHQINKTGNTIIAIDLPSGMYADRSSVDVPKIMASETLSFQAWKPSLIMEENASFTGNIHLLNIGLHPAFENGQKTAWNMLTGEEVRKLMIPRKSFSHKGDYGHALLLAGSKGKTGAALLAAEACLRSGAGLLTVHLPSCGYEMMQTALPEAMVSTDVEEDIFSMTPNDLSIFKTIGIGPGLGKETTTAEAMMSVLKHYRNPMVIDADALNIIAQYGVKHVSIPPGSILTPHPGEFVRLFGASSNHFERVALALQKAAELQSVIILKTKFTLIACPDGSAFFNPTGNPGMAKGGSGDVLTGILTGLLARGYDSVDAAKIGVYIHGYAGDLAVADMGMESVLARDLISRLAPAFVEIQ